MKTERMTTAAALRRAGTVAVAAGALALTGLSGVASATATTRGPAPASHAASRAASQAASRTPAMAGTTRCGRSVPWPGAPSWVSYPVRSVNLRGRTVQLKNVRLTDWSYAYVSRGYRKGDRVWIDRSGNGGQNWRKCGPFARGHSNQVPNLRASARACLQVKSHGKRVSRCTGWYYDKD
jgi:hypothetical protein